MQRNFRADEPGEKLLGDISQVACADGRLYIAGVFDCFDGAIVGLSMQDHMRAELCCDALMIAVRRYDVKEGQIFHSDRGAQYTSHMYREALEEHGIE